MNNDERAQELAEGESLEILWSALYSALEADLSGLNWPKQSKTLLDLVDHEMHDLMNIAEGKNVE